MVSQLIRRFNPSLIPRQVGQALIGPLEVTPEALARRLQAEADVRRQLERLVRQFDPTPLVRKVPTRRIGAIYGGPQETSAQVAERAQVGETIAASPRRTPPVVIKSGDDYVLVDGSKRIQRALDAGLDEIDAVVYEV